VSAPAPAPFTHLLADFAGVPAAKLTDRALVGGLVIAAASAAGLSAGGGGDGAPLVRTLPHGGVTAGLLLDGCQILVHTLPAEGLLLLDVLVRGARSAADRAADVFARRLAVAAHATAHARGAPASRGTARG